MKYPLTILTAAVLACQPTDKGAGLDPPPAWFGPAMTSPVDTVVTFATIKRDTMRVRMARRLVDGEMPERYRYGFAFYGGRSLPEGVYHAYHYGDTLPSWWGYKLAGRKYIVMWWMTGAELPEHKTFAGVRRTYMYEED